MNKGNEGSPWTLRLEDPVARGGGVTRMEGGGAANMKEIEGEDR